MWWTVSLAAICVLLDAGDTTGLDHELDLVFSGRSKSDWENLWHKEKYSRCRETLIRHLYWACEKDIYRLTRRSDPSLRSYDYYENEETLSYPWLPPQKAMKMLRFKRSGSSSITSECCKSSGCTWEEYAEYCPTNKRRTYVNLT